MVTIDTMRTMLDLMCDYPEYKFSQSQASVYRVIEQLAPDMLEQIKKRVHEGRFEVTASTWVEGDKNMSSLSLTPLATALICPRYWVASE